MSIELVNSKTLIDGAKVRMTFSITGAHKVALATEALTGLAHELEQPVQPDLQAFYDSLAAKVGRQTVDARIASLAAMRAGLAEIRRQNLRVLFNPEPVKPVLADALSKTDASFEVDVFTHPGFELSSYEPVYVREQAAKVTEEMVNAQLMREMNRFATFEGTSGPVEAGDVVQVNMSTLANGVPEPQLSGDELAIVVSDELMPKGFVDAVCGMNVGEHKEFQFTNEEGDQGLVHYSVALDVLDKRRRIVPELTDEFVATHLSEQDKTVEEFRQRVRRHLEQHSEGADQSRREELADAELGRRLRGTVPDELIERTAAEMMGSIRSNAAAQGLSLTQFARLQGMDDQRFQMSIMMQARESLRQGLALDALFDHLGMELEEADYDRALAELAPGGETEARRNLQDNDAWYLVRNMAARLKAHDWLMKTAVFA